MPGLMTHSTARVLQKLLIDLGVASAPSAGQDWPILVGNTPDRPDQLIVVRDVGGIHDGRVHLSGEVQGHDGCQIIVRSVIYRIGFSKASEIINTLDTEVYDNVVTIDTSIYTVHSVSRRGNTNPIPLGKEVDASSQRELFSINCTVSVRQNP